MGKVICAKIMQQYAQYAIQENKLLQVAEKRMYNQQGFRIYFDIFFFMVRSQGSLRKMVWSNQQLYGSSPLLVGLLSASQDLSCPAQQGIGGIYRTPKTCDLLRSL